MNSAVTFRPATREDSRKIAELFRIASGGVAEYVWSTLAPEYPGLTSLEIGARRYARMQLGADGVFVESGIFKSGNPARRAQAIVKATTHFRGAKMIAEASRGLGEAMVGRGMEELVEEERLATRGW